MKSPQSIFKSFIIMSQWAIKFHIFEHFLLVASLNCIVLPTICPIHILGFKFNMNWYLHRHYYSVIILNVLLHYKSETNLIWNFTNSNCDNLNFLLLFILFNSLVDIAIIHLILNLGLNWLIEKMNSFATEFILNKINTIISKINYK